MDLFYIQKMPWMDYAVPMLYMIMKKKDDFLAEIR